MLLGNAYLLLWLGILSSTEDCVRVSQAASVTGCMIHVPAVPAVLLPDPQHVRWHVNGTHMHR
jgi:hypothetical protein